MGALGFHASKPKHWSGLWLLMWAVTSPTVVVGAFYLRPSKWLPLMIVGFLIPEVISVAKKKDGLPPLTHVIRHFMPDWFAFPLIYFGVGSVGANWLYPEGHVARDVGCLFALLGWLTDHFTVTYARPDPFPFSHQPMQAQRERERTPL